jgi:hypothetical protein
LLYIDLQQLSKISNTNGLKGNIEPNQDEGVKFMQNKIKSILFTTLLLSTAITSLNAMDPAGASSALHQQAQQNNWVIHPFEGELGLNTFSGFLKTFFVENGNSFPKFQPETVKTLRDDSVVVVKLADSFGQGIPGDLFVRLLGATAFQNRYQNAIIQLLQNPDYRLPETDDSNIKWDADKAQFYVDIPGFREDRGYKGGAQVVSWPAFRQYITVDVKASPSFDMFMKARELAKQGMSTVESALNQQVTAKNRDEVRKTLTTLLNKIRTINFKELENLYGHYKIFAELKQIKEAIAMRLEALGPVPAEQQNNLRIISRENIGDNIPFWSGQTTKIVLKYKEQEVLTLDQISYDEQNYDLKKPEGAPDDWLDHLTYDIYYNTGNQNNIERNISLGKDPLGLDGLTLYLDPVRSGNKTLIGLKFAPSQEVVTYLKNFKGQLNITADDHYTPEFISSILVALREKQSIIREININGVQLSKEDWENIVKMRSRAINTITLVDCFAKPEDVLILFPKEISEQSSNSGISLDAIQFKQLTIGGSNITRYAEFLKETGIIRFINYSYVGAVFDPPQIEINLVYRSQYPQPDQDSLLANLRDSMEYVKKAEKTARKPLVTFNKWNLYRGYIKRYPETGRFIFDMS